MKASEIVYQQTDKFDPTLFYAEEYGHCGEDACFTLNAFKTKRERYLFIATASNVDRYEISHREVVRTYFYEKPKLRVVK